MTRPTELDPRYANRRAHLPYELHVDEVEKGVAETYRLFHGFNDFLVQGGFPPLEELLLGNSLSGIIFRSSSSRTLLVHPKRLRQTRRLEVILILFRRGIICRI